MVRAIFIILITLSTNIYASTVNLEFQGVTISELSQLVVKGIIKRDYVLSPDVLTDSRKVSISLKNQKQETILPFFKDFLQENDISIVDKGSFLYLHRTVKQQPILTGDNSAPSQLSNLEKSTEKETCLGCETFDSLTRNTTPQDVVFQDIELTSYIYRPKFKTSSDLSQMISFAGAVVSPVTSSDVLIYKTKPEKHQIINDLLIQLDKNTNDLMVKVYLYEVTKQGREGSAFNMASKILQGKLGLTLNSGQNLANTITLNFPDVSAIFSAFETDNRFKVVSSPSLRVKHNKSSRFSVGSEVPVLGSVTQNNNAQPTQSINYKPSGVILEIIPQIFESSIDLQLTQQVSNFVPTTNGVNNSPTLIKRELNTTVTVKDGDLIFMGGLDETRGTAQSTGLPFLPKFMRSNTSEDDKTDILMVLHVQRI